jgi:sulfotransferase family protein
MSAQYLTIDAKHRPEINYLTSLADFSVTPGEAVNADIVRDSPNISLYCLDDADKRAIFVELPPSVDLAAAPFVYQTQAEQAQRLIALPYETFRQVAATLPAVGHFIMIYMTGRSGSTLLSHLFNELDNVLSLSEPDVGTQFVHLRSTDGSRDTELRELLDCTVRFLFKPTATKTPSIYALKLRNEALQVMDLFQATFPQAKNLFLYRDALGWVTSFYRIFKRFQAPESMPFDECVAFLSRYFKYDFTHLAAYLDTDTTEISLPQELTLWWLAVMEWYLAQYARGIPILAVRYADLNAHREQVVTEIFRYCGLPPAKVRSTLEVFTRDSQAGTGLARDNPQEGNKLRLSDEQRNQVTNILQRHGVVKDSDFVAPGTLRV